VTPDRKVDVPHESNGVVPRTSRTRLRRFHKRADYSRETINAILDEALICHMGFVQDGQPYVIPTAFGRVGDSIYLHGSAASRALRQLGTGIQACVTVTLTDGIVLARTAFNHSFNYRSVVILGTATEVTDPDEKETALRIFTERLIPGRWDDIRWPTRKELKATSVLVMPLDEVSAKVRVGPPVDEGEDFEHPAWAGVIPLTTQVLAPEPDPALVDGIPTPQYVTDYALVRPNTTDAGS
jgi:nitroimidazol reductase NimA-like FMN-containing flavoprotein (pyridoxamine 5'-phosphate oxidase superfamily)